MTLIATASSRVLDVVCGAIFLDHLDAGSAALGDLVNGIFHETQANVCLAQTIRRFAVFRGPSEGFSLRCSS